MAKSIVDRVIDQGIMTVAREITKAGIKKIKPKIDKLIDDQKKAGKRRDNED